MRGGRRVTGVAKEREKKKRSDKESEKKTQRINLQGNLM